MLSALVYQLSENVQFICAGSEVGASYDTHLLEELALIKSVTVNELFSAENNSEKPQKEMLSAQEDDVLDLEVKQEEAVKESAEVKENEQADYSNYKDKNPVTYNSTTATGIQTAGEKPAEKESAEVPANLIADNKKENNLETKTEEKPFITEIEEDQARQAGNNAEVDKVEEEAEKEYAMALPAEPAREPQSSPPVSYSWGSAASYTLRIEIKIANNGADISRNVNVSAPLLDSSSPYQTTILKSVNHGIVSSSGRVKTFSLGDIAPGDTKTIIVDFDIIVRPVSINSTCETINQVRKIYDQSAKTGNCRTLAREFIKKTQDIGIIAREVIGYARPRHGPMTKGCLHGCRHSWVEFYVDDLGWVPVDLTFQYFAIFPHASHIIEGYSDQSISVEHIGGSLTVSWNNHII